MGTKDEWGVDGFQGDLLVSYNATLLREALQVKPLGKAELFPKTGAKKLLLLQSLTSIYKFSVPSL